MHTHLRKNKDLMRKPDLLTSMVFQVVCAMKYLEAEQFIHRDLVGFFQCYSLLILVKDCTFYEFFTRVNCNINCNILGSKKLSCWQRKSNQGWRFWSCKVKYYWTFYIALHYFKLFHTCRRSTSCKHNFWLIRW